MSNYSNRVTRINLGRKKIHSLFALRTPETKAALSVRNELRQMSARCFENNPKGHKKAVLIKIKISF